MKQLELVENIWISSGVSVSHELVAELIKNLEKNTEQNLLKK